MESWLQNLVPTPNWVMGTNENIVDNARVNLITFSKVDRSSAIKK
jgi:hypothetical protein